MRPRVRLRLTWATGIDISLHRSGVSFANPDAAVSVCVKCPLRFGIAPPGSRCWGSRSLTTNLNPTNPISGRGERGARGHQARRAFAQFGVHLVHRRHTEFQQTVADR